MSSGDYMKGRNEGMAFAYRLCKEEGPEAMMAEIERRGVSKTPIGITKAEEHNFAHKVRENAIDTILILSMVTLHDAFGFSTKRLNKFKELFELKADCIGDDYQTWQDQLDILLEECGMEASIRWVSGVDPTANRSGDNEHTTGGSIWQEKKLVIAPK